MSAGTSRHYRLDQIVGRHFVQTGKAAGLGPTVMRRAIEEILACAPQAPGIALAAMPADFANGVHVSIAAALERRLPHLASALEEL
jgi:serine/threonine-protein kinase HipA